MTGKLREFIFLTLASLLFWVIRVPEIGGKSVLEGKSMIFSDLVDFHAGNDHVTGTARPL